MLIDMPFHYKAKVRQRRKRLDDDFVYSDSVPVEVAEPTDAEAPVAIRMADPDVFSKDRERVVEMRWFEDKLWRPYEPSDGSGKPKLPRDANWLREVCRSAKLYNNPLSGGVEANYRHGTRGNIEQDANLARVVSSTREEVAADITRKASEVMLFEGMVWVTATEPYLTLSVGNKGEKWVSLRAGGYNDGPFDRFRLDEANLIKPFNEEVFRDGEEPVLPDFEVLMPECLRLRTTEPALAKAAESIIEDMKESLAANDVDYFRAFAHLRDSHAAFAPLVNASQAPDPSDIAEALQAAVTAHASRVNRPKWDTGGIRNEHAEQALARYESRSLDLDAFEGIAP